MTRAILASQGIGQAFEESPIGISSSEHREGLQTQLSCMVQTVCVRNMALPLVLPHEAAGIL